MRVPIPLLLTTLPPMPQQLPWPPPPTPPSPISSNTAHGTTAHALTTTPALTPHNATNRHC